MVTWVHFFGMLIIFSSSLYPAHAHDVPEVQSAEWIPLPFSLAAQPVTATDSDAFDQINSDELQRAGESFRIARVEYRGGGDWYSSPTALTNLINHARENLPVPIDPDYDDVRLGSSDIHDYPFLFMTGHGYIEINDQEMDNLRTYLRNGGFLHVDDDYGFDPYVRPLLDEIFPDQELEELPADHPIYSVLYPFPDGRPPKVHEHDGLPAQAFGLYHDGRLVVLYTYESNPSDGWAYDQHDNPQEIIDAALQFGMNLLVYVFTSGR
jgi:hypothetical protein